jgi:hypothetical protein
MEDQDSDDKGIEYIPLKVTSGIILKIGAGIYNSVAGAIKELVSNSFDADATSVVISTDYPNFEEIKIVDNGSGMTRERFKMAMRHIGSSLKGIVQEKTRISEIYKRPVIGHLGIGLMALSQICDEAVIESKVKDSNIKFTAKLDFSDFRNRENEQQRLAQIEILQREFGDENQINKSLKTENNPDKIDELHTALELLNEISSLSNESLPKPGDGLDSEELGYCVIYTALPAIPDDHGTTIILRKIDDGVKDLLRDEKRPTDALPINLQDKKQGWDLYRKEIHAWPWKELCERLRLGTSQFTHESLPMYQKFLWELAMMSPVEYLKNGPVINKPKILEEKKEELDRFNFSLTVDNRPLFKPVLLPTGMSGVKDGSLKESLDYFIEPFEFDKEIDHERLKCKGYVFWQRKQIIPSSLRGIQIYIKNVGIGLYDHTLMNFANLNVTSRAGQISGEIYIEEGLERALNVDRNSFRETDAHYLALQQYLWEKIGSGKKGHGIFGKSVQSYYDRKDKSDQEKYKAHTKELDEIINKYSSGKLRLSVKEEESVEPYRLTKSTLILNENSPRWPKPRDEKYLSQRILFAVRAAIASDASPMDILNLLEELLLN